jgi:hypothetical protein
LAALASAANSVGFADPVLIVADGDGHPDAVRREIENDLAGRSPDLAEQTDIIVLEPTFEKLWRSLAAPPQSVASSHAIRSSWTTS